LYFNRGLSSSLPLFLGFFWYVVCASRLVSVACFALPRSRSGRCRGFAAVCFLAFFRPTCVFVYLLLRCLAPTVVILSPRVGFFCSCLVLAFFLPLCFFIGLSPLFGSVILVFRYFRETLEKILGVAECVLCDVCLFLTFCSPFLVFFLSPGSRCFYPL